MYRPDVIVLDFETALTDGTPSTEYYREDFRAVSCAFAWRDAEGKVQTLYCVGEDEIRTQLEGMWKACVCLVAHNLQFEYGVMYHRFAPTESILQLCTMRLTQVSDNGGKLAQRYEKTTQTYEELLDSMENEEDATPNYTTGLGLVSAASRWLPAEYQNHKEPFHAIVRERAKCKKGQEGKNLNVLTPEELRAYNVRDAEVTLALYERLTQQFSADGYTWGLDHTLYRESAKRIARAKGFGVPVNRKAAVAYKQDLQRELSDIARAFRSRFEKEILEIETDSMYEWANSLKTQTGRDKRKQRLDLDDSARQGFVFNIGSNQQLAALCIGKLGMTAKFTTKKGSPSFKSAFLGQWGEVGELIKKRRKRMLVLSQVEALLQLSTYDGKWHIDLRAAGTTTGRFAGGRA